MPLTGPRALQALIQPLQATTLLAATLQLLCMRIAVHGSCVTQACPGCKKNYRSHARFFRRQCLASSNSIQYVGDNTSAALQQRLNILLASAAA
jgi:hypothetical protein